MNRNGVRGTQRGFLAVGITAGFGLGGLGLVEWPDNATPTVAEPAQQAPTLAARAGVGAGANQAAPTRPR